MIPARTTRCTAALAAILLSTAAFTAHAQDRASRGAAGPASNLSCFLGRPTDRSIALSVLAASELTAWAEYGVNPGTYTEKTDVRAVQPNVPCEFEITALTPNTRYYYRLLIRTPGKNDFTPEPEATFHTQRAPGSTFTFALQGDSHPERDGKMFSPELYWLTMRNAAKDPPDFYLTLGDDFSIERLISRKALSQANVDQVYAYQRSFLGVVGRSSPLFLVNGNHEQAARYLLDDTADNAAVLAGLARTCLYPLPAPDAFYTGDAEEVKHVGLLRDYYAWTWGDALFVVIDPYWHSAVPVDDEAGGRQRDKNGNTDGGKKRDLWEVTLGETQYRWFTRTLTESKARWKFVFCHHVLGTGRGGIERAGLYEWGGKNERGVSMFAEKRPGWELPIHQLMVKTGVTIFFQGHDHLYARQELDGIVYQSCPNPADDTYQAFNRDAYRSGDVLPNSGHLRVTVSPEKVTVDYVRSWLPKDENTQHKNNEVSYSYTIPAQGKTK